MRGGRGNLNTFHLPVTVSLDPHIAKNVPFIKGVRLQFLAEGFNLLNHGNIVAVGTTRFALSNLSPVCGIAGTPCLPSHYLMASMLSQLQRQPPVQESCSSP